MEGRVAIVTGGSRGVGLAVARRLHADGMAIALGARTAERLAEAARELGSSPPAVRAFPVDLTHADSVAAMVDAVVDAFGRVDVLVNCAGNAPGGVFDGLTDADWDKGFSLKFMGYVRCIRAVLPVMQRQRRGCIINVVGNNGIQPAYWEIIGGAVNAADLAMTQGLGRHYGRFGIRVNAVNPGPVDTSRWKYLTDTYCKDMGLTVEQADDLAERSIPLGRIVQPQDVAEAVAFLASDAASMINATWINVDGGQDKGILDCLARPVGS